MSACDTCPKPGSCCAGFTLNIRAPAGKGWKEAQLARLWDGAKVDYFELLGPLETELEHPRPQGKWRCTKLGADGRCTVYEQRPELCRSFDPASDPLCVLYVPKFKGIPIVKEAGDESMPILR